MNTIKVLVSLFFVTLVDSFIANPPTRIDSFEKNDAHNVFSTFLFEVAYIFIVGVSISIVSLFIYAVFMTLRFVRQKEKQISAENYLKKHSISTSMIVICDLGEKVNIPSLYANTQNEARLTKRQINSDYRMIMTMNINPEKQFYQKIVIYKTGIIKFNNCRDYASFTEASKQFLNLLETHIHPFVEFIERSQSINSHFKLPGKINRLSFYYLLADAGIPCVLAPNSLIVRYGQMKIFIYENGDMAINNAASYEQIINYHKQVRKVYKHYNLSK